MLTFLVPGEPVGKQRARKGKGGRWYTPKKTADYEAAVRLASAAAASKDRLPVPPDPKERWYVEIGISTKKKRGPDVDNVAKSVLDGMGGVVYADDSQVDSLYVHRDRGPPGVIVSVNVDSERYVLRRRCA